MTRAPRHTTLADRAAASSEPARRHLLTGELDQRGVLAVVHATQEREAWAAARYVASRATNAGDCRYLLDILGLLEDFDEGLDLP